MPTSRCRRSTSRSRRRSSTCSKTDGASYGLTIVFVAHDLAVVQHISDRVAVMYLGQLVEVCPSDELYAAPRHPYTAGAPAAIRIPTRRRPDRIALPGELPSPIDPRPPAASTPAAAKLVAGHLDATTNPTSNPTARPPSACHYPNEPKEPKGV